MRKLPPLTALRAFEVAARHRSFTRAATELCVTHSAISHQIRQLENWFDTPLFLRQPTGVTLTLAGQHLMSTSTSVFDQIETVCRHIRKSPQPSTITLACPGSFLLQWLIPRLEAFETDANNPDLKLQTRGTEEDVLGERIDALILSGRAPWPSTIATQRLVPELIGPVCSPHCQQIPTAPTSLIGSNLLETASRQDVWDTWATLHKLPRGSLEPRRSFDHLAYMLEAAVSGLGVAIAPKLLVRRQLDTGELIAPLGFVDSGNEFTLCTLAERHQDLALKQLQEWLLDQTAAER